METIIGFITGFKFNGLLGVLLYWVPLILCCIGYFSRTYKNYINDKNCRGEYLANPTHRYYNPTDTVGDIVGRLFVTVIPGLNLAVFVFDVFPDMFSSIFSFFHKLLNIPLVPEPREK